MHCPASHLDSSKSGQSSGEACTYRALGPQAIVGLQMRRTLLREMENSATVRIVQTSFLMFLGYLVIGLLLAILPSFVHLRLGLTLVWAGIVVGTQYASTLLTRPRAGLMTDLTGPKATVLSGQAAFLVSGFLLLISAFLQHRLALCISVLLLSRVVLGYGESSIATGTITWGLGRVGPEKATQVISWSGIASYSAMALGAPLGIWIERHYGFAAIGATVVAISLLNRNRSFYCRSARGRWNAHKLFGIASESVANGTRLGSRHSRIRRYRLIPDIVFCPAALERSGNRVSSVWYRLRCHSTIARQHHQSLGWIPAGNCVPLRGVHRFIRSVDGENSGCGDSRDCPERLWICTGVSSAWSRGSWRGFRAESWSHAGRLHSVP
jgi:hypothetical protein